MAFFDLAVKVKIKENADAVLYVLRNELELMQSKLGYAKTLDTETVWVWTRGDRIEMNRLEWIELTEAEIVKCMAHITAMSNVKE